MLQLEHLQATFYDAFIKTFLSFSGRIISAILWTPVCRRSPRTDLPLMCCSRYKASKGLFDVTHEGRERHVITSLLESAFVIMREEIWSGRINNHMPPAVQCLINTIVISRYSCWYCWHSKQASPLLLGKEIICWALDFRENIKGKCEHHCDLHQEEGRGAKFMRNFGATVMLIGANLCHIFWWSIELM